MKKNLRYITAAILIGLCSNTQAQNLNSAYFLDGYTYGHELNPAQDYDRSSYFSMPLLGNVNIGLAGNVGLSSVLMPGSDGRLTTFMNPSISATEALSGFGSGKNTINNDIRLDIISFGFHAWGGYNTFNLSVRGTTSVSAPYELFETLKNLQNKDYNIGDLGARSTEWVEIGLGHSRQITDAIRVGGKVKGLIGLGRADLEVSNLQLKLAAPDKWIASGEATADVGIKGFSWGEPTYEEYKSQPGGYNRIDLGNMKINNYGINGGGLAFDLGAEWDLEEQGYLDGMKLSLAFLDLGFIKWNDVHKATNYGKSFVFEGFNNIKIKDEGGVSIEDQADKVNDDFGKLTNFQDAGTGSATEALGATMNLGVEYRLPWYDKLSFGFLSTTRIQGRYTWNEERLSATVSPLKWLEGSINFGFGTLGTSFGWVLNIHPKGFNLFLGMDRILTKLSKQGIPTSSSANVVLGINFPLGKYIVKESKSKKYPERM